MRFILKYRLLHIIYWSSVIIIYLHYRVEHFSKSVESEIPGAILIYFWQVVVVYSLLYYFVPKYLNRQKYFVFIILAFSAILIGTILSLLTIEILYFKNHNSWDNNYLIMALGMCIDILLVVLLFLSADIIYTRIISEQRNRQLEKEKLEAELNFLKSQMNPHFLFNALNSIYVLISEDKKVAIETLLKFSALLRYQLYECKENQVEVLRELSFLNDYGELEKIRNDDNLEVRFNIPISLSHFRIAPFILIPFVENAFKHVSRYAHSKNYIEITAEIISESFIFKVTNTFDLSGNDANYGGIGLKNVRRRLELLYPERHELNIKKDNGIFDITLILYADKNELHHC